MGASTYTILETSLLNLFWKILSWLCLCRRELGVVDNLRSGLVGDGIL